MSKKEIIFLLAVLLIGAALFIGMNIYKKNQIVSTEEVLVTSDGKEYLKVPLSHYGIYRIIYKGGYNILSIDSSGVSVKEADCPGLDCVKVGTIHSSGESIVCLPHKLVITIL